MQKCIKFESFSR